MTPDDAPGENRDHPAVARLRAAIAAALKARERKMAEILEQDQTRANERRSAPSRPQLRPLLWHFFARDAHDLSAHAAGAIRVSPKGADAALSILQVLCEGALARGWSVKPNPDGCWLLMSGDEVKARATVRERFAPGEFKRDTPMGGISEKGKTGTGRFTLVAEGAGLTELKVEGTSEELQQKIQTGAVFDRLRSRLDTANRAEAAAAARRRERELRDVDALEARKAEERQRIAAALEAERREVLARQAAAWEEAERIRRYVTRVMAAGGDAAWGEWALQVADDIEASAGPARPSAAP